MIWLFIYWSPSDLRRRRYDCAFLFIYVLSLRWGSTVWFRWRSWGFFSQNLLLRTALVYTLDNEREHAGQRLWDDCHDCLLACSFSLSSIFLFQGCRITRIFMYVYLARSMSFALFPELSTAVGLDNPWAPKSGTEDVLFSWKIAYLLQILVLFYTLCFYCLKPYML